MAKMSYKESDRDVIGAINTYVPVFYMAAVEGKPSLIAFPDEGSKRYYVNCLKGALSGLAIQLMAYSVTNNRAYIVIASWDQAPVSFLNYLEAVNGLYNQYYAENFINCGSAFKEEIRHKRIKDAAEAIQAVAIVHSQPAVAGLCAGFTDYEFTSYNEFSGGGLSTLVPLYQVMGREEVINRYLAAHSFIQGLPQGFMPAEKQDKFDVEFENCLANFGYFGREAVPKEVLAKVIIDLNEKSGYNFDFITDSVIRQRKFVIQKSTGPVHVARTKDQLKYELLVMVVAEMCVRLKCTYDGALARLGAAGDATLQKDVIIYINNKLGYGYRYLMELLGFAYPNPVFFRDLVRYMCEIKGYSKVAVFEKLSVIDKGLIF